MIVLLIRTVYFLRLKAENTAVTLSWSCMSYLSIICYLQIVDSIIIISAHITSLPKLSKNILNLN